MRHLAGYWAKRIGGYLKHHRWCRAAASRALSALARLPLGDPIRRLELLARSARACPSLNRLARLEPRDSRANRGIDSAGIDWDRFGPSIRRRDLPKAILLKPPVSADEKGLLYVTFGEQWLRLLRTGQADAIAASYDLLLGPTWSPPHDLALLLAARLWPNPVYTLLSNLDDLDSIRRMSSRLRPVPLLASSFVNPAAYEPHLDKGKDYEIVMLANFGCVKRHWLLFHALRRLPRRYRVLLMGRLNGGWTEEMIRCEARIYGVEDRFDLRLRPDAKAVADGLCRSGLSLVFSQQEGSCIAVAESLFADTPVGLFRNARIGSKAFINDETGRLLESGRLAYQLQDFVETAEAYRPRRWALAHISCHRSLDRLNGYLRDEAHRQGRPWTHDLTPFFQNDLPRYLSAETAETMRPWQDDFAHAFGLTIGVPGGTAETPVPPIQRSLPQFHRAGASCSGS